jgi:hypothetical protein
MQLGRNWAIPEAVHFLAGAPPRCGVAVIWACEPTRNMMFHFLWHLFPFLGHTWTVLFTLRALPAQSPIDRKGIDL